MRVPVWLTLGVAALVIIFGVYRIRLAFRSDAEDERARARKGLYGLGRRTHLLIGIVYLLLGGALTATSFGWSPFGDLFGPKTAAPAQDAPRPKKSIPMRIDNLPPPSPAPAAGSAAGSAAPGAAGSAAAP